MKQSVSLLFLKRVLLLKKPGWEAEQGYDIIILHEYRDVKNVEHASSKQNKYHYQGRKESNGNSYEYQTGLA